MYKSLYLLLFFFIQSSALAQFSDSTQNHALFNSTGSVNHAKDGSSYLLNNQLRFEIKKKNILLNFGNTWTYGKSNSTLTNNDFSSSLDFNLYGKSRNFYYWGLATYNTSYSLRINNQLLAGAGVAYSIIDRPNAYLNISDGILYDLSDLHLNDTTQVNYHTYRNSLRLQFRFIFKELITFDGGTFWQPSLTRKHDYNIRSTFGLGFKLNSWLSLSSSLAYNKIAVTDSENLLLTYGLKLEKWF
ncbi:uncharacterized protein DUF481 [Arcticibacter pallidicorallinus]|uniref:Uncharacterized protein DUF481 n=1 Tax=Arcticibacter pallidicorallinus TaxID=1259464 RepID=A0A2T0U9N2_9SPHI|nr:DUF481 domain-containing protein [Arcticibacter pallidicorallinus]PRY54651.1 uncharacterized protein DUF481 [Arcticibacter pallidicorallinus]